MRSLYALQLGISPGKRPAGEAIAQVRDAIGGWVREKYRDVWGADIVVAFSGDRQAPLPRHEILAQHETGADADLVTLVWRHPGDTDNSLQWNTSCTVARVGERIELGLLVRIAAVRFEIRPARFWVGRPRLLTRLMHAFACSVSGQPVPRDPVAITASAVPGFVESLFSTERALPVVAVTDDNWSGDPLTDPSKLQERLLGFAQVVRLNKWATFQLADELGKERSCYNGAARVFWPGFARDSKGIHHPLYLPHQVGRPDFQDDLFDRLSRVATLRYADGPVTREARLAVDAARVAAIDGLHRARDQADRDVEKLLEELSANQADFQSERTRREEAELRVIELEDALVATRAERDTAIENLAAVSKAVPGISATPVETADGEEDYVSVADALAAAERRYGGVLEIADTARASASESRFAQPQRVFRALMAAAEVGETYFKARAAGRSMGPWEKAFEEKGFKFAHTESESTRNMYRRERTFTYRGESRTIYSHLTLGGGDRENCLQIYLKADDKTKRVVVYYCGLHLPYAKQST